MSEVINAESVFAIVIKVGDKFYGYDPAKKITVVSNQPLPEKVKHA